VAAGAFAIRQLAPPFADHLLFRSLIETPQSTAEFLVKYQGVRFFSATPCVLFRSWRISACCQTNLDLVLHLRKIHELPSKRALGMLKKVLLFGHERANGTYPFSFRQRNPPSILKSYSVTSVSLEVAESGLMVSCFRHRRLIAQRISHGVSGPAGCELTFRRLFHQ
jgi:hypothetical protein